MPEMSILNKLKNASGQMSNRLLEKHPLAGESLELRLQYLAAIALATAIDREATLAERQAFNGLAASLSIEAGDAEEQFNERANVEEDSIAVLFEALRARQAGQLYMLDLAWIHAVDGKIEENERLITEHLASLLGMPLIEAQDIHAFAVALNQKNLRFIYQALPSVFSKNIPREVLLLAIKKYIPFEGLLKNRWVKNNQQEVTDTVTGKIWSINARPLEVKGGKIVTSTLIDVLASKKWRLPKQDELKEVTGSNYALDQEVFSAKSIDILISEESPGEYSYYSDGSVSNPRFGFILVKTQRAW